MAVAGYNIYLGGVKQNTSLVTDLTYALSGLTPETAYGVKVSAVDDAGNESAQSAAVNFNTLATVTELQNLSFDSATTVLSSTEYKVMKNHPPLQLWQPTVYYRNGKSLAGFVQANSHKTILVEFSDHGLRPAHIIRGATGVWNNHDIPVINYNDNGRLYLMQENSHNINPPTLHKSKSDNDSLVFQSNVQEIGTESHTYFNITKNNGKLVSVGQYADSEAGFIINPAGTVEGTWNGNYRIMNRQAGETQRYQLGVNNKTKSNEIIICSVGRNNVPSTPVWFRYNVFKAVVNASGFLDYYTINGTLLRSPTTEAGTAMDATEVSQGEFFYTGGNTAQGYIPVPSLDELGNFYCVHGNGSGGYVLTIWKTSSATPVNQTLTFPDAPTLVENFPDQTGSCVFAMPEKPSKIDLFFKVNNGTRKVIRQYRTTDEGATLTFVQDIDFGFDVINFAPVSNYIDVGNNKNFLFVAGGDAAGDNDPVSIGIKKAAFGAIQPQLANIYDTIPAITESAFNATSVLSYFIESGKITNTGTTLNTVIDQSPNANNISVLGSPSLDDGTTPSYMTFDGVNDAIPLSPTLLAGTDNSYLILQVAEGLGGYFTPMTMSNNTNTNSYLLPELKNNGALMGYSGRYNNTTTESVEGDTPITTGFHVFAWLYRGYSTNVPMWLDGKMQLRKNPVNLTDNEGSYILPNGNTNLEIGRLVRSTGSGYYNYRMKHTSVHAVNSEAEIMERIKFVANKYGITLQNAYR